MKTNYLFPIIAGVLGFAIAWTLKPAPDAAPAAPEPSAAPAGRGRLDRPPGPRSRPEALTERLPAEVFAGSFPLADQMEDGPQTRSEAKLLRLTEALGLSLDQQAAIIRVVDETKHSADPDLPLLDDLVARGRRVEETLRQILSPEQFQELEELRVRERDNRIEARAFRALGQLMEEIDMSPGQREQALARLRLAEKERIQAIPAAATLLLRSSVLPTGPQELTMDGVLTVAQLATSPATADPDEARRYHVYQLRAQLEEKLRAYEGVLTPAQMGQLHAIILEEKELVDRMREATRAQRDAAQRDAAPDDDGFDGSD